MTLSSPSFNAVRITVIEMPPTALSEPATIVGSCLNCTTPANLLVTLAVILIGVGFAAHFDRRKLTAERTLLAIQ